MFICDVSKKEIKFFDGSIFTKLTADFDILYVRIQKQYKKIENVFVGKGDLHIIKDQPVFFFSSLYMKRFELSSHFVEEIGIEKILQYFYSYTIEEYISIQI